MSAQLYNNVSDALLNSIDNTQASFDLVSGNIPPVDSGDYIPIYVTRSSDGAFEIMHVTGVSGSTISVTRAAEGTSPLTFPSGESVQIRPTRQSLLELNPHVATATGEKVVAEALDDREVWVSDIAGLSAMSSSILNENMTARITTTGRMGLFRWVAGDRSSDVSDDPSRGVWVAPDDDQSGASGAWVRAYNQWDGLSHQMFGALADGVTDDHEAMQAAIDYCSLKNIPLIWHGHFSCGDTLKSQGYNINWKGVHGAEGINPSALPAAEEVSDSHYGCRVDSNITTSKDLISIGVGASSGQILNCVINPAMLLVGTGSERDLFHFTWKDAGGARECLFSNMRAFGAGRSGFRFEDDTVAVEPALYLSNAYNLHSSHCGGNGIHTNGVGVFGQGILSNLRSYRCNQGGDGDGTSQMRFKGIRACTIYKPVVGHGNDSESTSNPFSPDSLGVNGIEIIDPFNGVDIISPQIEDNKVGIVVQTTGGFPTSVVNVFGGVIFGSGRNGFYSISQAGGGVYGTLFRNNNQDSASDDSQYDVRLGGGTSRITIDAFSVFGNADNVTYLDFGSNNYIARRIQKAQNGFATDDIDVVIKRLMSDIEGPSLNSDLNLDRNSARVQAIRPNGANRNVDPSGGVWFSGDFFKIRNDAGSTYNITFDPSGISHALAPGEAAEFHFIEGRGWFVF